MKFVAALILLLFTSVGAQAQQSVAELEKLAIKSLKSGHQKDGERYLRAILKRDPAHPEALWQLAWKSFRGLRGVAPERRAESLYWAGPVAHKIARLANKRGDPAFGHYVLARQAWLYNAFDRAVSEIDQALRLNPNSTRYLMTKGLLLAWQGDWENDDATIEAGVALVEQARLQSRKFPTIHWREAEFHVAKAEALADLSQPPWTRIVEAYELSIVTGGYTGKSLARQSNSLSWAYRRAGRCEDAKQAAITALAIFEYESARRSLTKAVFCLETQFLGLPAKEVSKQGTAQ